jgi:GT2 family glycosyltransferase
MIWGWLLLLVFCVSVAEGDEKVRILVGSPIRQKAAILNEFLESLKQQAQQNYTLDYYFIDDNDEAPSKGLLAAFKELMGDKCTIIEAAKRPKDSAYVCNEMTHCWRDELIWKVAAFKDQMIAHARDNGYDYLFLVDSDLVMHPKTIDTLQDAHKDIISNIFWTSWQPGTLEMPQVWLTDDYTLWELLPGEQAISDEEKHKRMAAFFAMLRVPGVYEVGGLGACTLISRHALEKGVSFKKIKNITLWGEDRHFCVRAVALGLLLNVDTHYPAYHIYRETLLGGVPAFKEACHQAK